MPRVSVVIPSRDRAPIIRRAVESALAQTFTDLEVVVVVDGPDSKTIQLLRQISDPRLRVIELEESVGGSEARNIGVRAAKGEWIALLDDDDEWLPEKLASQMTIACGQCDPNYVVTTQYLYSRPGHPPQVWPGRLPRSGEHLSEFLFAPRGGFQTSVYLVPRTLFLQKPFRAGLKKHQDWDWFLQLATSPEFQVLWVPLPLSIYWAPEKKGSGVSTSVDWRFSAAWAKENLSRMTRRAYAMFLVRICFRGAAESGASIRDLLGLVRELSVVGRADARLWGEVGAALVLPAAFRRALSSWVAPLRHARGQLTR
jgi:glycosyltransferase involved in cell wall biosynthesis